MIKLDTLLSRRIRAKTGILFVSSALTAVCATTAVAQVVTPESPNQTPPEASVNAIAGDIIVTATRRSESARNIPLAISVISTDALIASGAKDLGDYIYAVPGVNYNKDGREGRGDITIRGVSTGALTTPLVGNYVDDVPIGATTRFADGISAYDQRLLDLDRIEILKGPQGTLYGASAMGGVLRNITRAPELNKTGGSVAAGVSTIENGGIGYSVNGTLNVPLSQTIAIRASGFRQENPGYVKTTGPLTTSEYNRTDTTGGRIALRYAPTNDLTINLAAQVQDSYQNGPGYVSYGLNGQPLVANRLTRTALNYPETFQQRNELYSGTIDYDAGFVNIRSITGYQHSNLLSHGDFTGIYGIFAPFLGGPAIDLAYDNRSARLNKWTQEFRLVSPTGKLFDWVAGVFYTHESGGIAQDIIQRYANGQPVTTLLYGPGAGFRTTYEEIAGYATGNIHLGEAFTATGGVRVAHNKIDVLQINGGILGPGPNATGSTSETPVTYLASLRYNFAPRNNVYFRFATGYRAGGPNPGLVDPLTGKPLTNSPIYQSDSLRSYEAGYKGDIGHGLLSIESAIYRIDWSNIQQTIFLNGSAALSNFGEARIQGIEFAANIHPVRGATLGGSLSAIDPKLRTTSPIGLQALSGSVLPNTSKFTANLTAQYDFNATPDAKIHLQIDQLFEGKRNAGFNLPSKPAPSRPNLILPAFRQTDFNASVTIERYSFGFYVRNLFDTRGLLAADTTQAAFGLPVLATPIRPRTIGATAAASF